MRVMEFLFSKTSDVQPATSCNMDSLTRILKYANEICRTPIILNTCSNFFGMFIKRILDVYENKERREKSRESF